MNKLALNIITSTLLVFASSSHAEVIFSCDTKNKKKIEVRNLGSHIGYKFGRDLTAPELQLKIAHSEVSTDWWKGIGRSIWYSLTIPNGETSYSVYWSMDKMTDEHEVTSGVHVEIGDKHLATVYCDSDTLVQHINYLDFLP